MHGSGSGRIRIFSSLNSHIFIIHSNILSVICFKLTFPFQVVLSPKSHYRFSKYMHWKIPCILYILSFRFVPQMRYLTPLQAPVSISPLSFYQNFLSVPHKERRNRTRNEHLIRSRKHSEVLPHEHDRLRHGKGRSQHGYDEPLQHFQG